VRDGAVGWRQIELQGASTVLCLWNHSRNHHLARSLAPSASLFSLSLSLSLMMRSSQPHPSAQLANAVAAGDVELVGSLLAQGAGDGSSYSWERLTPIQQALHNATRAGHLGVCRVILEHHTKVTQQPASTLVNSVGGHGYSPLQLAITLGFDDIARVLMLEYDADFLQPVSRMPSALMLAARKGNEAIMRTMIECLDRTPSASNDSSISRRVQALTQLDGNGRSVLHEAIESSNLSLVRLLLDSGVSVNASNQLSDTALHQVVRPRYNSRIANANELIHLLLEHRADLEARGRDDSTPLLAAFSPWKSDEVQDMVQMLLDLGADITASNSEGYTALHLAVECNMESIVLQLLDRGASIDARTSRGHQPINLIQSEGVLRLLMERSASINATSANGDTPILKMAQKCSADGIRLLLSARASANATNASGITPLHAAISSGKCTQLLLEAQANVNATSNKRVAPLHLAAESATAEPFLLLEAKANVNARM